MMFLNKLLGHIKFNHRSLVYRQAGDTIVEVLISTAILAIVLGTAYATSNHSLQTGTAAGNRSQALAYAQGQLEFIKNAANSDPATAGAYEAITGAFCVNPDGTPNTTDLKTVTVDGQSEQTCPITSSGQAPYCIQPKAGAPKGSCVNATSTPYGVVVKYDSTTKVFTVTTQWPDTGDKTNKVSLNYKVPALIQPATSSGGGSDGGPVECAPGSSDPACCPPTACCTPCKCPSPPPSCKGGGGGGGGGTKPSCYVTVGKNGKTAYVIGGDCQTNDGHNFFLISASWTTCALDNIACSRQNIEDLRGSSFTFPDNAEAGTRVAGFTIHGCNSAGCSTASANSGSF